MGSSGKQLIEAGGTRQPPTLSMVPATQQGWHLPGSWWMPYYCLQCPWAAQRPGSAPANPLSSGRSSLCFPCFEPCSLFFKIHSIPLEVPSSSGPQKGAGVIGNPDRAMKLYGRGPLPEASHCLCSPDLSRWLLGDRDWESSSTPTSLERGQEASTAKGSPPFHPNTRRLPA